MVTLTGQFCTPNSHSFIPQTMHQARRVARTARVTRSAYGLHVTTVLPELMPTGATNDMPSEPVGQARGVASSTDATCKILVVEDECIVALDLSHTLRRLGYVVSGIAASGEQAIQLAIETQPDLIMMDIRLQGKMDGIEVAQHIRTRLGVPVIFLTAFVDENTVKRAQTTQPAGFLCKPYVKAELQEAIEAALHRPVND